MNTENLDVAITAIKNAAIEFHEIESTELSMQLAMTIPKDPNRIQGSPQVEMLNSKPEPLDQNK
jgi:hypothetical protein